MKNLCPMCQAELLDNETLCIDCLPAALKNAPQNVYVGVNSGSQDVYVEVNPLPSVFGNVIENGS